VKAIDRKTSTPRKGWLAERWVTYAWGGSAVMAEPERAPHKVGRPPRFAALDLEGLQRPAAGDFSAPREFVVEEGRALVATAKMLGGFGAATFAVEAAGAYNLAFAGDEVFHLVGRGADCRLVVRDANTGTLKREQPMAGVSAFGIAGSKMLVGLEDGRLVLADRR
jgi:hypothetical protein